MSRPGLVGFVLLVAVVGFVLLQSLTLEAHTCEVCISYRGGEKCRTVGGATIAEARAAAITNACAFLSSGVTDSMACGRETPVSETCR